LNLVWGDYTKPDLNRALGQWCQRQIGLTRQFQEPYSTMGVFDGDELIAVMVFHNWHDDAGVCEISGAATNARWLPRPVLYEMFSYPFKDLRCQNVVMRVDEENRRLKRILTAYGFQHVNIPRLRGRDKGENVFWLTDDAWKANKFNRKRFATTVES
jgi:RimJ/RimL family protein N-acetyltransferase